MPPKADLAAEDAEESWLPHGSGHSEVEVEKKPRCPSVPPKADLAAEKAEEEWLPQRSLGGTPAGSRRYVLLVGHPDVEVDPEVEKKAAMSQSAAEG